MDKVICIQDTELEEAGKFDAASGDWYQFVEIPYCHWSGLFKKLEYDEQLEDEYNEYEYKTK